MRIHEHSSVFLPLSQLTQEAKEEKVNGDVYIDVEKQQYLDKNPNKYAYLENFG